MTAGALALCVGYIVVALMGDVAMKLFGDGRTRMLAVGMAAHATAGALWAYAMRMGASFGRSLTILILANLAGAVLIDRYAFGAELAARHLAGIGAAVVAIILLV